MDWMDFYNPGAPLELAYQVTCFERSRRDFGLT